MLEFQEKRKIKRYLYSKVTLTGLVIAIVVVGNAVWGVYKKQDVTRDNLSKTATSLESLQTRERMLTSEIERLKTEVGIEAEIREKYGLVKPSEEVILIVDKDGDTDTVGTPIKAGFWHEVKEWFK